MNETRKFQQQHTQYADVKHWIQLGFEFEPKLLRASPAHYQHDHETLGRYPFQALYIPFKYYTLVSVHFLPTWTYNYSKTYVIWPTLSLHITFASATEMLAPNWKIHSNLCHYVAIVESSKDSSLRMWVPVKFSICQRSSSNWLIWLTDFIRELCRTVVSHVRIIQLRVIQHSYKCNTEVNPKTVGIDDAKKSHDCHHQSTRRKPNTISLHCDLHTKQHACNV